MQPTLDPNSTNPVPIGATMDGVDNSANSPGVANPIEFSVDALVDDLPGQIGPYFVKSKLGEGGMGCVYLAEQRHPIRRQVALKVVRAGMGSKQILARFDSERQALARMDHPHIAKVLDAGTTDRGEPYFVMEFVAGKPIVEFADHHQLDLRARLGLFRQVCAAIAHAHSKAILHRDIKNANVLAVMSDAKPAAKVIDFGIAKAIGTEQLVDVTLTAAPGMAIGTLYAMSPEQADGSADIDTRTDVYALGVLLYELLSGRLPITMEQFKDQSLTRAIDLVRSFEPLKPSTAIHLASELAGLSQIAHARSTKPASLVRELSRELEWIPLKALRKDRDRRYASVEQLDADIENYLEGRPLIAGPESRRYRLRKFVSRNRAGVTASGLAAVSLFAGVTGWTVSVQRERDRTDAARQTSDAVAGFAQNAFLQASPYVGNANATLADGVRAAVLDLQQSDTLVNAPALRAQLEVRIAEILIDVGEFDSAGVQAQSALERLAGMSDAPAGTVIAAHNVLGTARLQQNQPEKALEHYNAAFAIASPEPGPKSLARADHLNKTGSVYLRLRDFSKAQDVFEQALAIHQSQPVPDRKSIAATLNMLGSLFDQQQQFDQAGDYYSRMLEIRREILKPDDIALAQGLNNLGSVLAKQKQFAPAATMLAEALAIYDARASSSHPDSLRCRATLASAQRNLNQLDESVVNYQQAIAGMRDRQPLMAGDLANARSGLGRTLLLVPGREDDAKDNLLAAFEYRLSMNDPGMNVTAAALVELFERTNQPEQARAIKARLESSQNSSPTGDRK